MRLINFTVALVFVWNLAPVAAMAVPIKSYCNQAEIKAQSCLIKKWQYTIKITTEKLIFNDKVWHDLKKLPYSGDGVFWKKIGLRSVGNRKFLDIRIWAPPQGEVAIQSLYWLLYEINEGNIQSRLHKEIQKRRYDKESKKNFYDKPLKVELRPYRDTNEVYWRVGKKKGRF